ncbi:PP2C family protein-serine/threonine phosphatase [Spectribacter hydrogenooxidans]|uniref:Protein phosphatase 2C domain-containing protein n=1 Tax=Spectribacter hydrogenoxidans TaxID=3075608 RepID=A0ABU3BYV5_9GAMM|nr:protein phosphatase 2C domain-containing protein [Salinisphaera sp. W335]MDT0634296.1 protein phosphatase 2C domain-containing protein [Salinisphaera sp. W335]
MDIHGDQIQGARRQQEDSLAWTSLGDFQLAVVADGMGGHPGGDVASNAAIDSFVDYLRATSAERWQQPPAVLEAALRAADARLHVIERDDPALAGLGTTLAALLFAPDAVYRASVGDSLIYRLDGDRLARVNEVHGDGPMVSSCLGPALTRVDVAQLPPAKAPHPRYLIASDGIETLPESALAEAIGTAVSARAAVTDLLTRIDSTNAVAQDNVTVVAALPDY